MGRADSDNLGVAFALVIGAGAATGLGAAVVFVPALVKLASRRTLAGALGLSAGVMTYVSFVEIFSKSSLAFEDAGYDEDKAYKYATLCFFGGVVLMVVSANFCDARDEPSQCLQFFPRIRICKWKRSTCSHQRYCMKMNKSSCLIKP